MGWFFYLALGAVYALYNYEKIKAGCDGQWDRFPMSNISRMLAYFVASVIVTIIWPIGFVMDVWRFLRSILLFIRNVRETRELSDEDLKLLIKYIDGKKAECDWSTVWLAKREFKKRFK